MNERPLVALLGLRAAFQANLARSLIDNGYGVMDEVGKPDIVILDGSCGVTLTMVEVQSLEVAHPSAHVVVLNSGIAWTGPDILMGYRHGISAYLSKPDEKLFFKTLEMVLLGELVVPRTALASMERELNTSPLLSRREIEILRHLALGETNKVIARAFCVAEATVKVHVKAILRKLRLHNRTQAAVWGHRFLAGIDGKPVSQPLLLSHQQDALSISEEGVRTAQQVNGWGVP